MLARNNVFDMKCNERFIDLMESTILTAISGSRYDQAAEWRGDPHGFPLKLRCWCCCQHSAGFGLQNRNDCNRTDERFILAAFSGRKLPFIREVSQFVHAMLKFIICPQCQQSLGGIGTEGPADWVQ